MTNTTIAKKSDTLTLTTGEWSEFAAGSKARQEALAAVAKADAGQWADAYAAAATLYRSDDSSDTLVSDLSAALKSARDYVSRLDSYRLGLVTAYVRHHGSKSSAGAIQTLVTGVAPVRNSAEARKWARDLAAAKVTAAFKSGGSSVSTVEARKFANRASAADVKSVTAAAAKGEITALPAVSVKGEVTAAPAAPVKVPTGADVLTALGKARDALQVATLSDDDRARIVEALAALGRLAAKGK